MADNNLNYTLNLKDQFRATMKGAQMETSKLDKNMDSLSRTAGRIGGVLAGAFAIDRIASFTKTVTLATAAASSFQNTIMATARTEGEGYQNLRFLNDEVDQLGLNLSAARNGYKTFTGALMGTNLQGVKGNKIFRQVSEATTVLGLSAEQTEGSFLALGQMMSKGTVQAEELRGQLAERIPGAFQIGARAMGMTTKQLGEAMQKGLINSQEFLTKFGDELEKTFGGKLEKSTHSLQSNLNRMETEWQRLQENIGNSQRGILNDTISWVAKMTSALNKNLVREDSILNAIDKYAGGRRTAYTGTSTANQAGFQKLQEIVQNSLGLARNDPNQIEKQKSFLTSLGEVKKENFQKSVSGVTNLNEIKYQGNQFGVQGAIIAQGLKELAMLSETSKLPKTANETLSESSGRSTDVSRSIGSPTEVSGARPQNITINVEKVVETINIVSETPVSGVQEAKAITSKAFLEMLNDANTMVE